jgi:hypothetical protein
MLRDRKRWFLLLLPFIICLLWLASRQSIDPSADPNASHTVDRRDPARESSRALPTRVETRPSILPGMKYAPGYLPIDEARLQDSEQGTDYLLTGKVMSEQEEPLPGAIVSLHNSWAEPPAHELPVPMASQTCDLEGRFTIRLSTPIQVFVSVRKEKHTRKKDWIDFSDQKTVVKNYRLLPAPACVDGYVYDEKGHAIAGAAVSVFVMSLSRAGPLDAFGFSPPIGIADSAGRYTIDELPEGPGISVSARSQRHLPESETVILKADGCQRVNFHLAEALGFSFQVKNRRGALLPGSQAVPEGAGTPGPTSSDEHGMVKFAVPPQTAPFKCRMMSKGYHDRIILLNPIAPPSTVVLDDGEAFHGRIVGESREIITGAKVKVTGAMESVTGYADSDEAGRFTVMVGHMPVTKIDVSKAGYLEQRLTFDNNNPALSGIEILMKRPEGGIFGRVFSDSGSPAKRFSLRLIPSGVPFARSHSRFFENDSGKFTVNDVACGTYDLRFESIPNERLGRAQVVLLEQVEIRKGCVYGEILVQFPPRAEK